MLYRCYEYLSIADAAGVGSLLNHLHQLWSLGVSYNQLQFDFGYKIDLVFGAAVCFGVALLASKPLTSLKVMPLTPKSVMAFFTSSSMKGLMMHSIFSSL